MAANAEITAEGETEAPRVAALSAEERTQLMKEGKCFRCKQKGHLKYDCPTFAQKKQA